MQDQGLGKPCHIAFYISYSELDESEEELGKEEFRNVQLGEKAGLWRRRRRGAGFFKGIARSFKNGYRRNKQALIVSYVESRHKKVTVRLCPFDMCPATEHSAHKACDGKDLNHTF